MKKSKFEGVTSSAVGMMISWNYRVVPAEETYFKKWLIHVNIVSIICKIRKLQNVFGQKVPQFTTKSIGPGVKRDKGQRPTGRTTQLENFDFSKNGPIYNSLPCHAIFDFLWLSEASNIGPHCHWFVAKNTRNWKIEFFTLVLVLKTQNSSFSNRKCWLIDQSASDSRGYKLWYKESIFILEKSPIEK